MSVRIPASVFQAIRRDVEAAYPAEGCGFLIGAPHADAESCVTRHQPMVNLRVAAGAGRNRYEIAPGDFLGAEKAARSLGLEILGTYHSHPDHPARPSEYDREHAWPFYQYLIISVERGVAGAARVWELAEDRSTFDEHVLEIEEQ
jgi:proteasome lid subunit RPN8/RPN11